MRRLLICLPLFSVLLGPVHPEPLPRGRTTEVPAQRSANQGVSLPTNAEMERLARSDPVAFLQNCLRRYQLHVRQQPQVAAAVVGVAGQALGAQPWEASATLMAGSFEVNGYRLTMHKQESIDGTLHPKEVLEVCLRERPHSVAMIWIEGARRAERALYVEGENNGKLLVRPKGALARKIVGDIFPIDVDGAEARQAGRYTLREFGLRKAAERSLAFCKADLAKGAVRVDYLGVQKVKDAADRPCWTLRFSYAKPQRDGCTEALVYLDTDTWLQVGSVLKRADGSLIASYYFRDIRFNPEFKPSQFRPASLRP